MKRYASLRWKLTGLIAGGSIVAASIAAAGFCWVDLHRYWQHAIAETDAIAAIVASQVGMAITLDDKRAASDILGSLAADTLVTNADLFDSRGRCVAEFNTVDAGPCALPALEDGIRIHGNSLVLVRPVMAQGERLGTLVLKARVASIGTTLYHYLGSAALTLLFTLIVAAVIAIALQSRISKPVLAIAHVAQGIALTHRFNNRVTVTSSDELGILANSFNLMLEEIERRDAELAQNHRRLEEQVEERNLVNRELRSAKEKAEDAARLKSQFLANMSHEIRTPMNGVVGMISLVLERCKDAEDREQLTVAQTAAQSLVTLLNDILDLSKIEAGKMTLESIDFDLRGEMQDALRIFEVAVDEKKLTLNLDVSPDCPRRVRGDPVRLRQVLINLVGNAVKFTAKGGVGVEVCPAGPGHLRFSVQDTGIGIAPGKRSEIFDAFTQADGSHTRRFGGTGLGLTITRRLVRLMGGELDVDSKAGRGSCFHFDVPMAPSEETVATRKETPPIPAALLRDLRVLVAEDNAINQKVIDAMLRRQGWTVVLVGNGKTACEQFLNERFDLVLMDIQMPEMDGLEATRWIRWKERERDSASPVPIIALTAHASEAERENCLAAGMDSVITKPVNLRVLYQGIAAVLAPSTAA